MHACMPGMQCMHALHLVPARRAGVTTSTSQLDMHAAASQVRMQAVKACRSATKLAQFLLHPAG